MSSIRVFSHKSFQFHHPNDESVSVTVPALSFAHVPEWVKESTMFKLAMNDESKPLEVTETRADEIQAELNAEKAPQRNKKNNTDKAPTENTPANDGE